MQKSFQLSHSEYVKYQKEKVRQAALKQDTANETFNLGKRILEKTEILQREGI